MCLKSIHLIGGWGGSVAPAHPNQETVSFRERTDVTAVPAAGVVAETMMALVVANEALRKFGGDSVEEFARNHDAFLATLKS